MLSRMIATATGIAVVCWIPELPPRWCLLCLALAIPLCVFIRSLGILASFLAGLLWGCLYGYQIIAAQLPVYAEQQALWVEGQVLGLPEQSWLRGEPVQRFDLELSVPACFDDSPEDCVAGLQKLRLKWYGQSSIKPGQHWRLLVKLRRPHGLANPGGFDYHSWLIGQRIGAVGYVREHSLNTLLEPSRFSLDWVRWQLADYLLKFQTSNQQEEKVYPVQGALLKHPELLAALALGDKRGISREQWQLFADTGTSHLMVISGLHIGLVCSLVFFLSRYVCLLASVILPVGAVTERMAYLLTFGGAVVYALLAGFSLPTQRALLMLLVFFLALYCHRQISPAQGLVTALLVCLIWDPLAPAGLSFWLSFVAVACILYGVTGRRQRGQPLWGMVLSQYLVFLGLMPVVGILLGKVTLLAPLANILLLPVFGLLLVPLNLLALILAPMTEPLALIIWQFLDALLSYCLVYLQTLSAYAYSPQGQWALQDIPGQPLVVQVLALLAVLIILLPRGVPLRWMGLLMLLPLFIHKQQTLNRGDLAFTVLDVGQGLSVVVETLQHQLVYDVGAKFSPEFDMADTVLLPYLRHRGINQLNKVVLSHNDNDHAGSWAVLRAKMDVDRLYYGESSTLEEFPYSSTGKVAISQHSTAHSCHQNQSWQWDGVNFDFMSTDLQSLAEGNNASCVLRVTAGDAVFLLPGDIDQQVERQLLNTYGTQTLQASVLVAPHHGSQTSSSWAFVKAVSAEHVVFSSGYQNQFAHPRTEVLTRYKLLGSQTYTTSKTGAVSFMVLDGNLQRPKQYRLQHRRYWFDDLAEQ